MGIRIDRRGYVTDTTRGLLLGKVERESANVWWAVIGRTSTMATTKSGAIDILKRKAGADD